jgi:hypothetical protein
MGGMARQKSNHAGVKGQNTGIGQNSPIAQNKGL